MRIRVRPKFRRLAVDGRRHQGLTELREYYVIEIDNENYRVIDDSGEPILYPKPLFQVLDSSIPARWRFVEYADGEYFLDPDGVGGPGFYEEYFNSNGDREAQAVARRLVREALVAALSEANPSDRELIERDLLNIERLSWKPGS